MNGDGRFNTGLRLTWSVSWNRSAIQGIKGKVNTMKVISRLIVIPTAHAKVQNAGRSVGGQSTAETATDRSLPPTDPDTAYPSISEPDSKASITRATVKEEPKSGPDLYSIATTKSEDSDTDDTDHKIKPEM